MPQRLDSQSADFAARFSALLDVKREAAADVEASGARDHRRRGGARRPRADRTDAEVRSRRSRQNRPARRRGGDRRRGESLRRQGARCAQVRARPHRGLSRAAEAEGRALHRRARRRAGRQMDRDRGGRALRAGRHRRLSVLGADECACRPRSPAARAWSWWCRRPTASLSPLVLAAAKLAGVDEIYRVGGAQAVAALAYGTETIKPVAKIVGPGNAYVAAAKRLVFGKVGIDMIAGPSEVLILADATGNPDWIAADLLAQAEHDASAQSILITDDAALADEVEQAVAAQLKTLPRAAVAGASWRDFGAIIMVREARRRRRRWSIGWRPSIWRSRRARPRRWPRKSAMPARSSSARIRRKRSATTSPAPTTCCRPRARRASPRAWACSIS